LLRGFYAVKKRPRSQKNRAAQKERAFKFGFAEQGISRSSKSFVRDHISGKSRSCNIIWDYALVLKLKRNQNDSMGRVTAFNFSVAVDVESPTHQPLSLTIFIIVVYLITLLPITILYSFRLQYLILLPFFETDLSPSFPRYGSEAG
jgi:hypothetical protein